MSTLVTVLIIIVALLLVLVVLIQNPKGGGLSAGTSANQVMGVQRTTDFLEKLTWGLAIALLALSLAAKMTATPAAATGEVGESELKEKVENTTATAPIQNMPKTNNAAPLPGDTSKK